ncbi:MAG TPA: 16S rRNA (uracil(1498)-N(3))-methyltransferase [Pseudolabrys sp.]|nr:16S rRNA (uracil(1498)-N(3))-methyltransferase [Pseudolabrys sp.]
MDRYDFRSPRLYVETTLGPGVQVAPDSNQANYLRNVLRLRQGDKVLLFNGRDGEWNSTLVGAGKRAGLTVGTRVRAQTGAPDLHFLFAPLKHARLDYMVQKAVEMGVSRLQPVITQHTQVTRVNLARMRANAIEAAQQCGILALPEIGEPVEFDAMMNERAPERLLVFCDEDADIADPVAALERSRLQTGRAVFPLAVLTGPEGGFAEKERAALLKQPNVVRISLGPRILRADTAAVAALALVQAVLGDWSRAAGDASG